MASIKFGTIVTAASGKLGGHYFSIGQGGAILATNRQSLGKHQTSKKLWGYIKRNAEAASQAWQSFTDNERAAWEAEAANWPGLNRVGDTMYPRGYSLFMKVAGTLQSVGQPAIISPSPKVALTALQAVTINSLSSLAFTVSPDTAPQSGEVIAICCTRTMSAGNKPGPKDFRIVQVFQPADIAPYNIYSNYVDIFGKPLPGGTISVMAYIVNKDTGQKGLEVFTKDTV